MQGKFGWHTVANVLLSMEVTPQIFSGTFHTLWNLYGSEFHSSYSDTQKGTSLISFI